MRVGDRWSHLTASKGLRQAAILALLAALITSTLPEPSQAQTGIPDVPVLALVAGNESITLSWTVNDHGEAITQHRMKLRIAGETTDTRRNLPAAPLSYTLEDLTKWLPG